MAIAVVQASSANAGGGTWAGTLTSVGAGNTVFLVATAYNTSGNAMSSSSPLLGGSSVTGAAKIAEVTNTATNRVYCVAWMLPNVAGGETTAALTVTNSLSISNVGLLWYEVSGLGASPAVDQSSTGNNGGTIGTAVSAGTTPTTTAAAEFVLGAACIDNNTAAGSAGYTSQSMTGNTNSWSGYQIASSTGTFTWAQTASSNSDWAALVVTVEGTSSTVYATQQAVYHDSGAGADICILEGAARSTSSQAYSQTPASMWQSSALTVGTQISPKLSAYLAAYPNV